jgi:hypothetical protein
VLDPRRWRDLALVVFDRALAVVAALLCASLLIACFHDVSQGYDVWYYHLPFAARLTGIVGPDVFAFSAENQARYDGFPLFAELLQGIAWRITGRPEATSLVSLAGLVSLPLVLRRAFGAPAHLAFLGLFAIPLVHIHTTAAYVDLPANAAATVLILITYRAIVDRAIDLRALVAAAGLAAATANAKFQLVPVVVVAALAIVVVVIRQRPRVPAHLAVVALAIPLVFATPLKNTLRHGNPVWPIELHVAGHAFPSRERAYDQSPPNLAARSRPVRFLHSVLELDNAPIASKARWSLDQWAPADDPSCRMGGYFGAYVALNLIALAAIALRRRRREHLVAIAVFGVVTAVAALVPQSHELRYYMHWMLLLVCLNVALWAREGPGARAALGLAAALALAVVVWSTGGGYLYASGIRFADFVAKRTERAVVDSARPGERLCLARQPFTFLYAAPFHGRTDYGVQEATRLADCNGARPFPELEPKP